MSITIPKETLISELQRFYKEFNRVPRERDFRPKPDGYLGGSTRYRAVFGTWNAALKAAGMKPLKMGNNEGSKYSKEFLISELHRFYEEFNERPTLRQFSGDQYPHYWYYTIVFGTWNAALIEAGLNDFATKNGGYSHRKGDMRPTKICPICGNEYVHQSRKTCGNSSCVVTLRMRSQPTHGKMQ